MGQRGTISEFGPTYVLMGKSLMDPWRISLTVKVTICGHEFKYYQYQNLNMLCNSCHPVASVSLLLKGRSIRESQML